MSRVIIDNFDHDASEPKGLRGAAMDIHILSTANRVSVFWITETQSRACRVQRWQDSGELVFNKDDCTFPWLTVEKFEPKKKAE